MGQQQCSLPPSHRAYGGLDGVVEGVVMTLGGGDNSCSISWALGLACSLFSVKWGGGGSPVVSYVLKEVMYHVWEVRPGNELHLYVWRW